MATTPATRRGTAGRRRGRSPALRTDLPVLGALLACSLTVSAPAAHLLTAVALVAAVGVHLRTRRRFTRLFRRAARRVPTRVAVERACAAALVVTAAATGVTGVLCWLGLPADYVWHGGTGYLLLGLAGLHLIAVWRRLRARLRPVPGTLKTIAEQRTTQ